MMASIFLCLDLFYVWCFEIWMILSMPWDASSLDRSARFLPSQVMLRQMFIRSFELFLLSLDSMETAVKKTAGEHPWEFAPKWRTRWDMHTIERINGWWWVWNHLMATRVPPIAITWNGECGIVYWNRFTVLYYIELIDILSFHVIWNWIIPGMYKHVQTSISRDV